jgi:hypothetical protein
MPTPASSMTLTARGSTLPNDESQRFPYAFEINHADFVPGIVDTIACVVYQL